MFESNDTFVEQAVKHRETTKEKAIKIVCIVLTVLAGIAAFLHVYTLISGVLFVAFLVLSYVVVGNKNIEYEYDYTNGSLEIAKIIDNSKRKKLITIESEQIRLIAAEGTNESLKYDHVQLKVYDCSANDGETRNYIMVAHDDKNNSDFKVIFNPSEKLISAMKRYNKRDIYE